jgi:hypothetical protein
VAALHAVYGNPEATAHMPFEPRTLEQVAALVDDAIQAAAAEPRRLYALAVTDAETREVVGVARGPGPPPRADTVGLARLDHPLDHRGRLDGPLGVRLRA